VTCTVCRETARSDRRPACRARSAAWSRVAGRPSNFDRMPLSPSMISAWAGLGLAQLLGAGVALLLLAPSPTRRPGRSSAPCSGRPARPLICSSRALSDERVEPVCTRRRGSSSRCAARAGRCRPGPVFCLSFCSDKLGVTRRACLGRQGKPTGPARARAAGGQPAQVSHQIPPGTA